MAVYQGARLRTNAVPAGAAAARHAGPLGPTTSDAAARIRPMGLFMAAVMAATILGLVYLTQTLGSSVTSREIGTLEKERGVILSDTITLQMQVEDAVEPVRIVPRAKKQSLKRLGGITVLSAP